MEHSSYGILIAAIVAIVAIVGLVILFGNQGLPQPTNKVVQQWNAESAPSLDNQQWAIWTGGRGRRFRGDAG